MSTFDQIANQIPAIKLTKAKKPRAQNGDAHFEPTIPHPFFDQLRTDLNISNDAALARALGISPYGISKVRHGELNVSPKMMIAAHMAAGWTFQKMFEMVGEEV